MKGRYEQPRNPRKARPYQAPPQQPDSYNGSYDPQNAYDGSGYGNDSYGADSYNNPSYENYPQNSGYYDTEPPQEGRGIGWGILGFFFPLIGLILCLCWKRKKPRASKASGIGALVGFIVFLVVVLGLVIGGSIYYNSMLDKVNSVEVNKVIYTQATTEPVETTVEEETEAVTEAPTEAPTEPPHATRENYINFLVVGQAARAGEAERFADTMMVCTLNTFDNSLTITSLLRDSFVQPPPFRNKYFGQIKLTTVYHMGSYYDNGNPAGSMELMNATLYDNFGLEIDHNFEVSFDMFTTVLDMLGGVQLEIDEAEANYLNEHLKDCDWKEYYYEPGMADLDGWSGLVFARMRKAEGDADSDIKRTARQRRLIEALMDKVKQMSLSDIQAIANEVLPMVTTSMSKSEITDMLKTVLPMLPTMEFKSGGTCPVEYSGVMVDIYHDGMYHSVLKFIPQTTKKAMREITLGEVPEE